MFFGQYTGEYSEGGILFVKKLAKGGKVVGERGQFFKNRFYTSVWVLGDV